ncbi:MULTISPECIES: sugar transferase [Clostridium]|uniref:Exopolysaccharide biosynthesis protein n=1 Tax=Clostridium manihotivorum TaxID=2320868 RepID=A0A410E098_9CLOT|nr:MULTISPECIES: sugar transferase [Clostridium]QAA34767.1 exopolysaccharide biosynthesis protein [Clostridium manihotivorum]
MASGIENSLLEDEVDFNEKKHYDEIKDNSDIGVNEFIYLYIKRLFDFFSALILLVTISPVLLIICVAIKLDSKGPIFFEHSRLGKCGKLFKVYKFRTMVYNAAEVFNNFTPEQKAEFEKNFKLDNDPRITKLGKFLRKTSLDELPQLINIIKGDLSVVGPRPIVQKEVVKYGAHAEKLFTVKPGLTGYWQANGRSSTSYEERVKMDMYYIDNRTTWLDIKLIFKTVMSVIKKDGAM